MGIQPFFIISLLFITQGCCWTNISGALHFNLGILNNQGIDTAIKQWSPLASYMTNNSVQYFGVQHYFHLVPVSFEATSEAVENGTLDFLVTNPGIYVDMQIHWDMVAIATLVTVRNAKPFARYGAVMFSLAENGWMDINDTAGKRVAAVANNSLGGYQIQYAELKIRGIEGDVLYETIDFLKDHKEVVRLVKNKTYDVGWIRTDIIEGFPANFTKANNGTGDSLFHIYYSDLYPASDDFPFQRSSPLVSEWPFAVDTRHGLDKVISINQVLVLLLQIPKGDPVMKAAGAQGWQFPLNYKTTLDYLNILELFDSPYTRCLKHCKNGTCAVPSTYVNNPETSPSAVCDCDRAYEGEWCDALVDPEIKNIMFNSAGGIILSVVTAIGMVIILVLIAGVTYFGYFSTKGSKLIVASSPAFMITSLVGGLFCYGVVYLLLDVPVMAVCYLQPIIFNLGFTLLFGAIFVKTHRIWRIFQHAKKLKSVKISDMKLFVYLTVLLTIESIILIVWLSITDVTIELRRTEFQLWQATTICVMTGSNVVVPIMIIIKGITVGYGVFLAVSVRHLPEQYNESKWLGYAIYNVAVCGVLAILLNYVFDLPLYNIYLSFCILLLMAVTCASWFFILPKFYAVVTGYTTSKDSTTKNSKDTATKNSKDTATKNSMNRAKTNPSTQ